MIEYLCKLTLKKLLENNLIKEEDTEVYYYGLELLFATIIKIIGIMIIAIIVGIVKETIVFILFFSSLRIQAGGYHAKTILNCFIGTLLLILTSIMLVKILPVNCYIHIVFPSIIISTFLIYFYAPLESENRPLDEKEKIVYRRRSLITVILGSVIVLFIVYINMEYVYLGLIALMGFLSESITLININSDKN